MTDDLESIVAECCAGSEGDMNAALHTAARLIAQARRERDELEKLNREQRAVLRQTAAERDAALARVRELEADNKKTVEAAAYLSHLRATRIATLEAELAEARKAGTENARLREGQKREDEYREMLDEAQEEIERLRGENHRLDKYLDETQERESGLREALAEAQTENKAMSVELDMWNRQADYPGGASQRIAENERLRVALEAYDADTRPGDYCSAGGLSQYLRAAMHKDGGT